VGVWVGVSTGKIKVIEGRGNRVEVGEGNTVPARVLVGPGSVGDWICVGVLETPITMGVTVLVGVGVAGAGGVFVAVLEVPEEVGVWVLAVPEVVGVLVGLMIGVAVWVALLLPQLLDTGP